MNELVLNNSVLDRRNLRTRILRQAMLAVLVIACALPLFAASVRGVVTTPAGRPISGAHVLLVMNGEPVGAAASGSDGAFQLMTGRAGRYFLILSSRGFRQLTTPDFYADPLANIERNLILEPEWQREAMTTTATGRPLPQAQTSEATTVLFPFDLILREDLVGALRLAPGLVAVQHGQLGSPVELIVRGGSSQATLFDGVDSGAPGGFFNIGTLSTTGVEQVEIERGPASHLYGAGAESGVVAMTTPHGTTSFPSLIFDGSVGNLYTSREQLELAGTRGKLDYYAAYSWIQTANDLPLDEAHVSTTAANFGWQLTGTMQLRGTLHYGVDASGVPGAWNFYHLADDASRKHQDLFIGASVDNQFTTSIHNQALYGAVRRREQYTLWSLSGQLVNLANPFSPPCYGPAYYGAVVTIMGANGDSTTGQAQLDCFIHADQQVANRDELTDRAEVKLTPHLQLLLGYRFQNERSSTPQSVYTPAIDWTNEDYQFGVHGDFKNRFFYTLAGALEHAAAIGTQTPSHAGLLYQIVRPRSGIFSGTQALFNFGDAVREPSLLDVRSSLYSLLNANGGQSTIQTFGVHRPQAAKARTYEAGLDQALLSNHLTLHARYFHNEFGSQVEPVGLVHIPELLPNLSALGVQSLEQVLQANGIPALTVNSQAFRAQGVEISAESGIGRSFFIRGGYTYLDSTVQRSFNSALQLLAPLPTYQGIPIGADAPLVGARAFQRPPHTGFLSASYAHRNLTAMFSGAFASRSDDSTHLERMDINGGDTLLLPNRNLDFGYASLNLGGSYQFRPWFGIYGQLENLTDNQHIAPIGFPSLPLTFRTGLRVLLGRSRSR